jgi:hypothetical protein
VLGWYAEPSYDNLPVIDGVQDGVVFDGPSGTGAFTVVTFQQPMQRFGFYMKPVGLNNRTFFTNRRFNDAGPDGSGAVHAPFSGGDVQALIFDVSPWTQANTWLVCFEDTDAGAPITDCCSGTDADYNDMVFEVHAFGATPIQPLTFGAIKARYR